MAGPTALLVAKIIKISERSAEPTRIVDKDALDVLRLLQSCETEQFVEKLNILRRDERTEELVASAVGQLVDWPSEQTRPWQRWSTVRFVRSVIPRSRSHRYKRSLKT